MEYTQKEDDFGREQWLLRQLNLKQLQYVALNVVDSL